MKYFTILLLFASSTLFSFSDNKIIYLEPVPGAKLVSTGNELIIGFQNPVLLGVDRLSENIHITGSMSGYHNGSVIVCSNGTRILFKPVEPFIPGEMVNVKLTGGLSEMSAAGNKSDNYSFYISGKASASVTQQNNLSEFRPFISGNNTDSAPPLPTMTVTVNNDPAPGYIFLANYHFNGIQPYIIITDNQAVPYWYKTRNTDCDDFKAQPNGHLTYYEVGPAKHYELDQNYNTVNTYVCGNGYDTDPHDLKLTLDGHAYLMAYDSEYVNMRLIVPGGDTNAIVVGLILQELDENKNVVFQWRSWDHFAITDAWHENLTAHVIDAVHGNSIEIDNDGNLIISSRHLDEVTKINHTTGDIMWRFGGKNNQFTFIGDTLKFTYQHDARRIANGNITLFDNGNYHTPHFSRAVEYSLDEVNMTATTVWEYRHLPSIYGFAMGNVQRLANGNTFICWGVTNPTVTEVKPDGTIAFEMTLPQGDFTYRAYKMDWNGPPIGIQKQGTSVPAAYKLEQNYPNPFNPVTLIGFSVPYKGNVKVVVYDVLGNEVKTVINETKEAGSYTVSFDASDLSSGVYFYKLTSGNFIQTRKMVLVK